MEKQFNDLIMFELDEQLKAEMLELSDNYDNDEIYAMVTEIDKMIKAEGLQYENVRN